MRRIACILVSDFSIAALIRSNRALENSVLAISATTAAHSELTHVSPRAREAGIRPGMTIAQARIASSDLVVMPRSEAAEHSAQAALADAAESISPVIEAGAPGCVWLDIGGLARIFPSEDELASELRSRVRRLGMEAAIGVASNREIAELAARCGGVRVIAPGMEREFLNWLPLDVLNLSPAENGLDLEQVLARWGLKRLGDLARLDPDAIGSRLGRRGVELVRLAHGGDSNPLKPRRRAEVFFESVELEYGIDNLEPLGFVMRAMLDRLVERLKLRGLVAGDLVLALGLSGYRNFSRRIAVAAPSNDARAMLTLINLSLEAAPPEAAAETIRIDIEPRIPRPAQTDMFLPPAPTPERLETTIARLAAICGPRGVGTLIPENSHRPEAVRLEPFSPPPPPVSPEPMPSREVAQIVIRTIRPAVEIEVMSSRIGPEFVRGPNLGARVVSSAGPWRRDCEWWRSNVQENSVALRDPDSSPQTGAIELPLPDQGEAGARHAVPGAPGEGRLVSISYEGGHPRTQTARALKNRVEAAFADNARGPGESLGWPGLKREERYAAVSELIPDARNIGSLSPSPAVVAGEGKGEGSNRNDAARAASLGRISSLVERQASESAASEARKRNSKNGFARDYYELALDDGGVYRVFRDLYQDKWFLDGIYD